MAANLRSSERRQSTIPPSITQTNDEATSSPADDTQSAEWGSLCTKNCLYRGHHCGHDMIRCCTCASWHHIDCISRQEEYVQGIWTCFTCRDVPAQVAALNSAVSTLTQMVSALTSTVGELKQQNERLLSQSAQMQEQLLSDNTDLHRKIEDLTQKQTPKSQGTALLGSSIIRDIDQSKLVTTECISVSGGLIKDIQHKIDTFPPNQRLSRAILVIGGNDCDRGGSGVDITDVLAQYKNLITSSQGIADSVTVSSVCPRGRSPEVTERITALNAGLVGLCADLKADFVDSTEYFQFKDGLLNDGYYLPDKVHLKPAGTNRLVSCLKLQLKQGESSAHKDHRRRTEANDAAHPPQAAPQLNVTESPYEHAFWQRARQKAQRPNQRPDPRSRPPRARSPHRAPESNNAPSRYPHDTNAPRPQNNARTRNVTTGPHRAVQTRPIQTPPSQRPTPLMNIPSRPAASRVPRTDSNVEFPALRPETRDNNDKDTQCQLCLTRGHSAVTCRSKDATCYHCGLVGHFSRVCPVV